MALKPESNPDPIFLISSLFMVLVIVAAFVGVLYFALKGLFA